ncbi:hypothetical protein Tco_0959307 [Tanacetum coccineum]
MELITPRLICPLTYQLLWNSGGDSKPDLSFDKSASLKRLFSSARVSLAEASKILSSSGCSRGDYISSCPPSLVRLLAVASPFLKVDLAKTYHIPVDLHPYLPDPGFTIDRLPADAIGIYSEFFRFSGIRVPF